MKSPNEKRIDSKKKQKEENIELFINAFEKINVDGKTTVKALAESGLMLGKNRKRIKRFL